MLIASLKTVGKKTDILHRSARVVDHAATLENLNAPGTVKLAGADGWDGLNVGRCGVNVADTAAEAVAVG